MSEPTVKQSHFGPYVDLGRIDGDLIALAVSRGSGWEMRGSVMLPHQLYVKKIAEAWAEPGVQQVVVFPLRSDGYINVTRFTEAKP